MRIVFVAIISVLFLSSCFNNIKEGEGDPQKFQRTITDFTKIKTFNVALNLDPYNPVIANDVGLNGSFCYTADYILLLNVYVELLNRYIKLSSHGTE